ncbi:Ff.00g095160.m01.CDS01 [Fusarium sp. VM40]|nr:Ff.00g095160.m01.CDS01 [Fusarium sp. VM40]
MRPASIFQLPATIAVVILLLSCIALASPNPDGTHITLLRRDEEVGSGCSTEGQWHCMTNSFQRCAGGHWSMKMAMAEGTKCVPGGYTDDYNFRIERDGDNDDEDRNRSSESQSSDGASLKDSYTVGGAALVVISWLVLGFIV